MDAASSLKEILLQVKKLNKIEKLTLLQNIALLIDKEEIPVRAVKLSQLSGLGSHLWQNVDIDKYVDGERKWL